MNFKYIQTLAVFVLLLSACGNKAIPAPTQLWQERKHEAKIYPIAGYL